MSNLQRKFVWLVGTYWTISKSRVVSSRSICVIYISAYAMAARFHSQLIRNLTFGHNPLPFHPDAKVIPRQQVNIHTVCGFKAAKLNFGQREQLT